MTIYPMCQVECQGCGKIYSVPAEANAYMAGEICASCKEFENVMQLWSCAKSWERRQDHQKFMSWVVALCAALAAVAVIVVWIQD